MCESKSNENLCKFKGKIYRTFFYFKNIKSIMKYVKINSVKDISRKSV